MRAAPATAVVLDGSPAWRAFTALLGVLAAAAFVCIAWLHAMDGVGGRAGWLVVAIAAGIGGGLLWWLCPQGRGRLRWDGAQWWFQAADRTVADEQAGELSLMLDLDGWMLLRFRPSAREQRFRRAIWLPVGSRAQALGPGLRAAVYSRRLKTSPNEPPSGQPTE